MVVLPEAADNRTLLGIDFLQTAQMVIDAAQQIWYYAENNSKLYDYSNNKNLVACRTTLTQGGDEPIGIAAVHSTNTNGTKLLPPLPTNRLFESLFNTWTEHESILFFGHDHQATPKRVKAAEIDTPYYSPLTKNLLSLQSQFKAYIFHH